MKSLRWSFIVLVGLFGFGMSGCIDPSDSFDPNVQMAADIETIDQFLAKNNIDAIVDLSGLRFHIETVGTGFPPRYDQTVKVDYTGKFLSGSVFDDGVDETGVLKGYIAGWQLALSVWPAGTKGTIYIPSPLAYGNQAVGSIPPNTILVFDVHLKEVVTSGAEKVRLAADIKTIDEYLASKAIDAVKDTTGVRYVITNPGTGPLPTWYTKIKFNYSGRVLATNAQFFNGSSEPNVGFDSRMIDFINGLKVGLSKVGAGGKITIYVPADLAFGPNESTTSPVPANSNVSYEIEVVELK
ncbi:MAG TPA: FKBP-type peptidyl-prolyl cis-trans isomerase [Cyclobacteriaceae bacterium]|nr:FKBP-type peptidyl-prolyl cis-trans isomerase [Cyclobacteriaceae bacterium]